MRFYLDFQEKDWGNKKILKINLFSIENIAEISRRKFQFEGLS